jgi:transglycosylase-like protein with SLT domain
MSAPHRWARRAMLSMLAGGGLSAAGFGGPLAGGALAAEAQPGTTTSEDQTPAVTETTPRASAPTQAAGSGSGSNGASGSGSGETSGTSETGSNTTSTAPVTPPSGTSTAPTAAAPAGGEDVAPTVVVQRSQQTTPGVRRGATVTGSGKSEAGTGSGSNKQEGSKGTGEGAGKSGPTTVPAGAPNGVAPAPQTAGEEAGALATLLTGSTVSAQALDFYRIPLFLLPVYQAAAFQYDVPWQVLAGINEIETDYGTDLSVSSAGALGWMQFMPGTWLQYGVDATDAGYADPYNPVDAIFAAARYLHAAGASHNLRAAIFSYNHSQEYVESVMLRARLVASYPSSVIATLTGLVDGSAPTAGARLAPGAKAVLEAQAAGMVAGASGEGATTGSAATGGSSNATAGAVPTGVAPTPAAAGAQASDTTQQGTAAGADAAGARAGDSAQTGAVGTAGAAGQSAHAAAGNSAATPGSTPAPTPRVAAERARALANAPAKPSQLVELLGDPGAPVVAAEDGRIEHLGHSHTLGRYLVLRDIYGDLFTYAGLGNIAPRYHPSAPPVKPRIAVSREPKPTRAATAGHQSPLTLKVKAHAAQTVAPVGAPVESEGETAPAGMGRVRLFAHPGNPVARAAAHSQRTASASGGWVALKAGSIVMKGTVLGHLDTPPGASAGQLRFAVRPAGDSATIDPQPLLQNWRQLDSALHPKGSKGTDALLGATVGDALLMSKGELERAVLADTGIQLDTCGRRDVAGGTVDKRVLAALLFLSRSGLQPTVSGLRCPRGGDTPSGLSVVAGAGAGASAGDALRSAAQQAAVHGGGLAVDITAINDIPVAGHQGPGSVTDTTIRALLMLHGRFAPQRIVSLMKYPETSSTEALPTAWNHIHLEFLPVRAAAAAHVAAAGPSAASPLAANGALDEAQWSQLVGRIAALPKPKVSVTPSSAAIRDPQAAPANHALGAGG